MLATAATVIASQAVISGAFSLTRQAIQLGFCPRMEIRHTSARQMGQIYIARCQRAAADRRHRAGPVLPLVERPRQRLRHRRHRHDGDDHPARLRRRPQALGLVAAAVPSLVIGGFLVVDLAFLGANLLKIFSGGWVPLVFAVGLCLMMLTWKRGRESRVEQKMQEASMPTRAVPPAARPSKQPTRVPARRSS